MPSYIEIDKNGSFPPSSNVGKMIFGITSDEQAALTDHLGNTTIIGGGSGMQIPVPIICLTSNTNSIGVKFSDYGFDFTQNNPEIFLFRWRNKRKSKKEISLGVFEKRVRPSKWVHPTTDGADLKWEGWKFFNGDQKYYKPVFGYTYTGTITGRVTEWAIPSTIKPYEEFQIDFNRYMFWNVFADDGSSINFDVNVFDGSYGTFSPTSHGSGGNYIAIGGSRQLKGNIVKYSLAVGVDNPDATKTNGLCPKIFGAFSEPFYSIIEKNGGIPNPYYNIMLVKYNHKNHTHVVT
jgi:hypothetical protein